MLEVRMDMMIMCINLLILNLYGVYHDPLDVQDHSPNIHDAPHE